MWWRAILEGRPPTSRLRSNVTKEERSAIKTLKQDRNIVIFQADIGAAVVVQNRKDYLDGAYKQLNGKDQNGEEVYHRVPLDSTSDFVNKVKDAVHGALAKDVIDQTTANFLIVENARPGICMCQRFISHNALRLPDLFVTQSNRQPLIFRNG